jgi:hypothetical protein
VDNAVEQTVGLLAVIGIYVMVRGRHWSAPFMLTALAGIIHER